MKRKMLLLERTMYRDGRTPFNGVVAAQLLGQVDEGELRRALARVQAKHPILRCTVVDDDGQPAFELQEKPEPIRLRIVERRSDEDWRGQARIELFKPFEASREPLVRAVWLRGGEAHELMLVVHHCVCDGRSTITLLQEILGAYDQPDLDLGTYGSLGSLEDLVPAKMLGDRRLQRGARWKSRLYVLSIWIKRAIKPLPRPMKVDPDQVYFHSWRLDEATTTALNARCKEEGVSTFAAACVAFLLAFRGVRGERALAEANTMLDARRFLPGLRADMLFGPAPGVHLDIKAFIAGQVSEAAFWMLARSFKADLIRKFDRLKSIMIECLIGFERLHRHFGWLATGIDSPSEIRHVTFTSMMWRPRLPDYRSFKLGTIHSPLLAVHPSPANTVMVFSYAGALEFTLISDESALPFAQATAIHRRAMEILRRQSGPAPRPRAAADGELPSPLQADTA